MLQPEMGTAQKSAGWRVSTQKPGENTSVICLARQVQCIMRLDQETVEQQNAWLAEDMPGASRGRRFRIPAKR
jgi:hypothetical protein